MHPDGKRPFVGVFFCPSVSQRLFAREAGQEYPEKSAANQRKKRPRKDLH